MGVFKRLTRKIVNTVNYGGDAIAAVGTAPVQVAFKTVSAVAPSAVGAVQSAGQVAGAATSVLQQNPVLAGALGAAVGAPGLGGLFGGGGSVADTGGGMFTPAPATAGIPTWLWIVGGIGAALGLFLILRRKS